MARKFPELTPGSLARSERQRVTSEENARAMADVERNAVAVRKNMERLRALREARDADAALQAAANPPPAKPAPKKRVKRSAPD